MEDLGEAPGKACFVAAAPGVPGQESTELRTHLQERGEKWQSQPFGVWGREPVPVSSVRSTACELLA